MGAIIVVQFDLFSHRCGGCICGNDLALPARTHDVPIVAAMATLFLAAQARRYRVVMTPSAQSIRGRGI